jgi:cysteine synthase B
MLDLIGNTPLVRVRQLEPHAGVEIYAKLEWMNPAGSVKDRAAARMIEEGERSGALSSGQTILDATSGNTGIAYAMIGAARGYRVRLCVPANANVERRRIMAAYGAELVLTDPAEGSDGAIQEARRLWARNPTRYFYSDQYSNDANWRAHYDTTGPEIWRQTRGRVTHFVAGLGTSGTFTGVTRRLRELNPRLRAVSIQPDSPIHGIEGLKHMPTAIVPGIFDPTLADDELWIPTDEAYELVRRMATSGLLIGVSGGAALAGAQRIASTLTSGIVVTVLPDHGERYLSERFWPESVLAHGETMLQDARAGR